MNPMTPSTEPSPSNPTNHEETTHAHNEETQSADSSPREPTAVAKDTEPRDHELDEAVASERKSDANKLYQAGEHDEALEGYTSALRVCPDGEVRAQCFGNRAACRMALGQYDEALKDCTASLAHKPDYLKVLLRRCTVYQKLDKPCEALQDAKKALEMDENNAEARGLVSRLEPVAAARQKQEQEEMIGKLKEMGNSILGKFGLSTENFKMQQDPKTGSYNVSFQK